MKAFKKHTIFFLFVFVNFLYAGEVYAVLQCSLAASCNSPDVVVFKMTSSSNSHAELPTENNYSQYVCCGGVNGLSNSCADTFEVVLRLSGNTNAHVEENTQTTAAYNGNDACLSVSSGDVSIAYQDNSCSGYDTTIASISGTPTNAHVGDANAYTRKVCGTATGATTGVGSSGVVKPLGEALRKAILRIADFNGDGRVDIIDLSILLYYTDLPGYGFSFYDLNQDGVLNFSDVSVLFFYWTAFR